MHLQAGNAVALCVQLLCHLLVPLICPGALCCLLVNTLLQRPTGGGRGRGSQGEAEAGRGETRGRQGQSGGGRGRARGRQRQAGGDKRQAGQPRVSTAVSSITR